MGIREFIEKQKRWLVPGTVLCAVACGYSAWSTHRKEELPEIITQAFFSDDEGATYFADAADKGYVFDHGGKKAQRVFVYRCGSGKAFVGVLARTAERVGGPAGATPAPEPPARYAGKGRGGLPPALELRKPNDSKWVLAASPEGQELLKSLCPNGELEAVLP
jgi:hypothetical protein